MLISAQPRVVSHARFTPPQRSSTSHSNYSNHNNSSRKQGLFEMTSNSQNSMPAQVSGPNTLSEAWGWGMEGLDQEKFGESFGNLLYSDGQDAESYYGQRSSHASMASANASNAQAYAYYQPTQFNYARNTSHANQQSHMGMNSSYSSMGYCRPSAIHNHESSTDTNYAQFTPLDSSLYGSGFGLYVNLGTSLSTYIPTSNPEALRYGLDKSSWYNPEPQINTDITISPAMASAAMAPHLSQNNWNQSFGSESSPSSALSPGDGSKRFASYESSELSFSDTDSEHMSEGDEGFVVLGSNDRACEGRKASGRRQDLVKGEVDKVYIPIAPNPQNTGGGVVARTSRRDPSYPTSTISNNSNEHHLLRRPTSSTRDEERDLLLVQLKRAGYSYKDIKRRGNFKEAESTLRGRYRTLTKSKEERVRRPCWTEKDLRLLREGVLRYGGRESEEGGVRIVGGVNGRIGGRPTHQSYGKVKWMQVAGYIKEKGGTYHFGNATCRKKWDEMVEAERERVLR